MYNAASGQSFLVERNVHERAWTFFVQRHAKEEFSGLSRKGSARPKLEQWSRDMLYSRVDKKDEI